MNKDRITKILMLVPFIVIICIIFEIIYSSDLVSLGNKVKEFDNEWTKISEENLLLRQELADLSSLSRIENQAIINGFIKPKSLVILRANSLPIAIRTEK